MNVRFSRQARVDLTDIARNIAKDNPQRAESFADELEASGLALSTMPNAFKVLIARNGQEIRLKPHGNYVILYRVTDWNIDILRIIHGARNYRRALLIRDRSS